MKKLTILFFILGVSIYGYKIFEYRKHITKSIFVQKHGVKVINERVFNEVIREPHQDILANQMMTLLVFIDPDRFCPSALDEIEVWVDPIQKFDARVYDVHFLLPKGSRSQKILPMLYRHNLTRNNVTFFEEIGRERNYSQFGIFKILYSLESGVKFFEFANDSEGSFENLRTKLLATVKNGSQ